MPASSTVSLMASARISEVLQIEFGVESLRLAQRVHVPNYLVLGFGVIVLIVQVLSKYMIIRYFDP